MKVLERKFPLTIGAQDNEIEKIGVARIILSRARDGISVILYSFKEADLRIAAWAKAEEHSFECKVSIHYADGSTLGAHAVEWNPRCGKPSISSYVRASLLAGEVLNAFPNVTRLKELEVRSESNAQIRSEVEKFLERYELHDL